MFTPAWQPLIGIASIRLRPDHVKQPMIVSHQHKLIFLKPRKVAGTSFEIALSKYLTEDDIISPIARADEKIRQRLGYTGPHNFNFAFAKLFLKHPDDIFKPFGVTPPTKFYNHMSARLAKWYLPADVWRDYRKISLVRNPWERTVSLFYFRNKGEQDISKFTPFFRKNTFYLDTNYANYMVGGENVIDFFIRCENFEEDMRRLEGEMPALAGLWDAFKGVNAKGGTRDKTYTRQQIFEANPEINAMVEKHNAWEIEKFGYRL